MRWNSLDDMDMAGKTVLVRVDINVPVEDGKVSDATRITRIIPTIKDIQAKGGRVVLMAHFGRPKGKVVPDMSLGVTVPALEAALGQKVTFVAHDGAKTAKQAVAAMQETDVVLLENLRFHEGEEKNDAAFAAGLAALGQIYCNDAFSAAHRAHASTEAIARLLPSCAGRLMEAELTALEAALGNPRRPLAAIVGGAKVSTKLELLGNLVEKVNYLIIGGGMANTFLAAQGIDVGKSLAEHDMTETAREIMAKAADTGCEIVLPSDCMVAREFKEGAAHDIVASDACPKDAMILDAGPASVARIIEVLEDAQTLIWNGPLGAFEIAPFDSATNAAAQHAAALTDKDQLISVAGGGDTVAALNKSGAGAHFTYISTAGGAFLEWMEGKTLPGVAALTRRDRNAE